MIVDLLPRLHKLKIILASTSPRRVEMMKTLNIKCEVVASSFAEDLDKVGFH
jgi:septum formation protein